ncbi:MAG TPA: hypothetical protein VHF89_18070, partial [Solirubrobacteraceae bacterium]|nr:hypothetical protein [Solirubrobacteraceae bacterium]
MSGGAMRFWGCGEDAHAGDGIPPHAEEMLRRELDLPDGAGTPRVAAVDEVRLRDPAPLPELPGEVRDDREARVLHAAGKAYPDLVRMRAGDA